jgi:hypothetical protein
MAKRRQLAGLTLAARSRHAESASRRQSLRGTMMPGPLADAEPGERCLSGHYPPAM